MAAAGFPHSLSPCLPAWHAEERATIGGSGGSTPNRRNRRSPWATGHGLSHPAPVTTLTQMSPWASTPGDISSFTHVTHLLLQPTIPRTPEVASMCMFPPRVVPTTLSDKLLPLQERINAGLEQLLANRATGDLCHKELDLNLELVAHLNAAQAAEAIIQAIKAIKQAKACYITTACALQQAHRGSVLELEHQTNVEERRDHQAFMEAFGAAIQGCSPKNWGTFLYPLQLLTSDVPLATLLGMPATV